MQPTILIPLHSRQKRKAALFFLDLVINQSIDRKVQHVLPQVTVVPTVGQQVSENGTRYTGREDRSQGKQNHKLTLPQLQIEREPCIPLWIFAMSSVLPEYLPGNPDPDPRALCFA